MEVVEIAKVMKFYCMFVLEREMKTSDDKVNVGVRRCNKRQKCAAATHMAAAYRHSHSPQQVNSYVHIFPGVSLVCSCSSSES